MATALAASAHVGVWLAMVSAPPAVHRLTSWVGRAPELEIEVEQAFVPADDADAKADGNVNARASANANGYARADTHGKANGGGNGSLASEAPVAGGDPTWTFNPVQPNARGIGLSKDYLYTNPGLAPAAEESGPKKMLVSGLDEHDRKLGLSPDGPFVAATQKASRDSRIPEDSKGNIVATFDAEGALVTLDCEGTKDADAWRDLKKDLLEKMKPIRLHVPKGVKGIRIRLHVLARLRTVTSHDKGSTVQPNGAGVSIPWDPTDALIDKVTVPTRMIDITTDSVERL